MIKNMRIAILGYGIEGKALLKYFLSKGYTNITVCDQRDAFKSSLDKDGENKDRKNTSGGNTKNPYGAQRLNIKIQTNFGKNYLKNLKSCDVIFRSPGISCLTPEIIEAKRRGQNVTSLTQYFFDHCPCPIIGVTGTKGKGTTSTLIYKILKKAGRDAYLGGNIGDPPLDFLKKLKKTSWVVLELSSFQLQDMTKSPHIAVILNVTSEHLDYHRSLEEYHEAKEGLVAFQKKNDYLVVNEDYEKSLSYASKTNAATYTVSRKHAVKRGAYIENGTLYVADETFLNIQHPPFPQNPYPIISTREVGLIGAHNLENILPAITVGAILKIHPDDIRSAVQEFRGLPHRLEFVAEKEGVKYYNDSFSTTPETTIAAIDSFTSPLIIIVGGSEKYSDFNALAEKIVHARHIKKVIFLGKESAKRIEKAIHLANKRAIKKIKHQNAQTRANKQSRADKQECPDERLQSNEQSHSDKQTRLDERLQSDEQIRPDISFIFSHAMSMNEALQSARKDAKKGDTVLLSPACASFDLFNNYKERGEIFKNLISVERGRPCL
ncbi:UDP-N-acetylmuramoyl-L-alanine--D-glutamate ligase [Candidatus Peregrinibacteria bacterium]|nr:UDP-N-acetylmuramoyl-L-alanine--D-glutamate ligase [Candidatus Peregrinibacteria bacterium]